jgi:hypothetical protein
MLLISKEWFTPLNIPASSTLAFVRITEEFVSLLINHLLKA